MYIVHGRAKETRANRPRLFDRLGEGLPTMRSTRLNVRGLYSYGELTFAVSADAFIFFEAASSFNFAASFLNLVASALACLGHNYIGHHHIGHNWVGHSYIAASFLSFAASRLGLLGP